MFYIYIFLVIIILGSAIAVNSSKNPVHSVCYLILVFLFGGFFLIFIGAEFLAFIFLIVYIGAIAVLFLFVVMLLNLRLIELKNTLISYLPLGILILIILLIEFLIIFKPIFFFIDLQFNNYINWIYFMESSYYTIHFIGLYLYNYYMLLFISAGILLFIATLGAIMIVYNKKDIYKIERKKQEIYKQYFVKYEENIKLLK